MKAVLALLVLLIVAFLGYVRLAPSDPARWNVDPVTANDPGPGGVRFAPGTMAYAMPAAELMQKINDIALSEPRTTLLAGSVAALQATYVARTRWIGFPDYITIRAIPAGDGATLAILSRLRFGGSDLGMNRARLGRWLQALDAVQ